MSRGHDDIYRVNVSLSHVLALNFITPWLGLLHPPLSSPVPDNSNNYHPSTPPKCSIDILTEALNQNGSKKNGRYKSWVRILCCRFDSTFMYSTVLDPYLWAGHWFSRAVHLFMDISLVFLLGMKLNVKMTTTKNMWVFSLKTYLHSPLLIRYSDESLLDAYIGAYGQISDMIPTIKTNILEEDELECLVGVVSPQNTIISDIMYSL